MKLSDTLDQLRNARAAHKAWVSRAEALIEGIPLEKNQVPMFPTDCVFGKWYYGEGQQLKRLASFGELEKPHEELHKVYMRIFKLLFDEPDTTTIGRLFGQARRSKAKQLDEATALIPKLRGLSDEMTLILEKLENHLLNLAKKSSAQPKPVPAGMQAPATPSDVIEILNEFERTFGASS